MLIPTKEIKQAAETATKRLTELEPVIRQVQTVLARHETAADNFVAMSVHFRDAAADVRDIIAFVKAAIVRPHD